MDIYKTEKIEVTRVEYKVCNKCKKEIVNARNEGVEIQVQWGYFSNKDGQFHKWDLCEDCYDEIVGTLEIPPEVKLYF